MINAWLFFKSVFRMLLTSVFHYIYTNPKWRRTYTWPHMLFHWEEKRTIYGKIASSCSPLDLSNFKKVSNEIRKLTCDLRKHFWKHLVSNAGTKPKAFSQYINSRIKNCPSIDELYYPESSVTSSHPEMAKLLTIIFLVFLLTKTPTPSPHYNQMINYLLSTPFNLLLS